MAGNWLSELPYFGLYIGLAGMDFFVMLFAMLVLWAETEVELQLNNRACLDTEVPHPVNFNALIQV